MDNLFRYSDDVAVNLLSTQRRPRAIATPSEAIAKPERKKARLTPPVISSYSAKQCAQGLTTAETHLLEAGHECRGDYNRPWHNRRTQLTESNHDKRDSLQRSLQRRNSSVETCMTRHRGTTHSFANAGSRLMIAEQSQHDDDGPRKTQDQRGSHRLCPLSRIDAR